MKAATLRQHLPVLVLALAAVLLRLVFQFYVDRAWEDALITVLHAENFWNGLGLTHFHNGQPPVHGFTSPLSVLIPLAGEAFGHGFGLLFLKLVSAFAAGATVLYAYAICRHEKLDIPEPLALAAAGYCAIEYQQILWGMAGLETQVVVLILLMSIHCLLQFREGREWPLGVMLGLCMLARPDLLFWCVIAGLVVLARSPRAFAKVTGWALLVYLPWIAFAVLYYGSFIPNTIPAKEAAFGGYPLPRHWSELLRADRLYHIFAAQGPVFAGYGVGFESPLMHRHVQELLVVLAIAGAAVSWRRGLAVAAVAAFVLAYTAYYLYFVPIIFGWYLPPINAVTVILAALGLAALTRWLNARSRTFVLGAATAAYLVLLAWPLPLFFRTERQIQVNIENGVRRTMGQYLASAMQPTDTISLEPLGYVSYYSRRDVYDTPGLANPRVVAFYQSLPREERTLYNVVRHFHPTFVALRPGSISMEYGYFLQKEWFRTFYESDKRFRADDAALAQMWHSDVTYDREFVVFKQREVAGELAARQWGAGASVLPAVPADAPKVPRPPAYLAAWSGKDAAASVSLPAVRVKVAFHARCDACERETPVRFTLERGGASATHTVPLTRAWRLVSLDSLDLPGTGPATLKLGATGTQVLQATQPFLMKVDERVAEFRDPAMTVLDKLAWQDFRAEGGWAAGAVFDRSLSPPDDRMGSWIGSRVEGDEDTGRVVSRPLHVDAPGLHLLTYTMWGPNVGNLHLGLDTNGDGRIDVELPTGPRSFRVDVDLTPYVGRQVRFIAADEGKGWGEWFGFAEPLLYRAR